MLVKVQGEYDYRFLVIKQADMLNVLNKYFQVLCNAKLPVEITDEDLTKLQVRVRGCVAS